MSTGLNVKAVELSIELSLHLCSQEIELKNIAIPVAFNTRGCIE